MMTTTNKSTVLAVESVYVDGSGIVATATVGRRWAFVVHYANGPRVRLHGACREPWGHKERAMLTSAIRSVERLVAASMPEIVGPAWLAANAALYADLAPVAA